MENGLLRLVVAGAIAAHGIGHVLFFLPAWGIVRFPEVTGRSWLLSGLLGDVAVRGVGGVLWLAVTVGLIGAGVGLFARQDWWRTLAIVTAAASLVLLVVFWGGYANQWMFNAAAMNGAMLVALLVLHWPSVKLVGA